MFGPGWLVPLALLLLPLVLAPRQAREALGVRRGPALRLLPLAVLLYLLLHLALPAPTLTPRMGFPASIALAGFLFLLFCERPRDRSSERLLAGAGLLALGFTIGWAGPRLQALAQIGGEWRSAALSGAGGDVALPERLWNGRRVHARGPVLFVGLDRDPADEYNACFARAYGLRSVRAVPE